jgi:hypothetical protein
MPERMHSPNISRASHLSPSAQDKEAVTRAAALLVTPLAGAEHNLAVGTRERSRSLTWLHLHLHAEEVSCVVFAVASVHTLTRVIKRVIDQAAMQGVRVHTSLLRANVGHSPARTS